MAVRDVLTEASSAGRTVPTFVSDPVWSLRCWPVDVELGGGTVQIPALPAADWLAVLMQYPLDLEDIFPGLAPGGFDLVDELLYSDSLTVEDLALLTLEILSSISGRPWWITMRLIMGAKSNWGTIGSKLVLAGVDADRVSLGAWLDAVFMIIVEGTPDDKLTMFYSQLEFPPPGFEPKEEITTDRDVFMDAMNED